LRRRYWGRYGATLIGLIRHHGVDAAEFLEFAHRLPGLEARVQGHSHDLAALARLPGRRYILTNAPAAYTERVLSALGLRQTFDGVFSIESMRMFGELRPKPDARMFRALLHRLGARAEHCVLVEDTLEHQKAAFALGIRTVWMQRWLKARPEGPQTTRLAGRKPAYVYARIRSLQQLHWVL
jgi:putative hydrolase of the HAD superfamily